ncbi:MAG: bifunctional hydroxymethylpyrimidine kinase/phosphomethylpyrimidine kinase [Candidatus Liptonbacteria bacterium]|nr:bifunctional hydroxymethylpyrimidine kinase/phosphomethylpyrimidine kinase [Candidatus Liptonbacteria bacterium]
MKGANYKEFIGKLSTTKVLVVGDSMLDLYISGRVERISPEAPVPVVLEESRKYFLGGAGNTAANVASLCGQATLVGVVGNDEAGTVIQDLCRRQRITPRLIRESGRPTVHKTRALAGHHQLLRIDREVADDISKSTEKKVVRTIKNLPDHDIVVLSDYAKGLLTPAVVDAVKKRFGLKRIIVNVKPSARVALYRNVNAITLNSKEAHELTNIDTKSDNGARGAAKELSKIFSASVVLTRGEKGMLVYDRSLKRNSHVSPEALQVFDVTGAGDTVVATLATMLAAGAPLLKAAEVASVAASIVVGVKGTAAIKLSDLKTRLA